MRLGIKDLLLVVISVLVGIPGEALAWFPWYFPLIAGLVLIVAFNYIYVPIQGRWKKKREPVNSQDAHRIAEEKAMAKVRQAFPHGAGIAIVGGGNNHVTGNVVVTRGRMVGIGVADSPGTTVSDSTVIQDPEE